MSADAKPDGRVPSGLADEDVKLRTPATIIVTGSSGCGKTHLVENLVEQHDYVFDRPAQRVVWAHSPHTNTDRLASISKRLRLPFEVYDHFPEKAILDGTLFPKSADHSIFVMDDLMAGKLVPSDALYKLYNVVSHHSHG